MDARYDDYLTQLAGAGDADPFDNKGVTGMHAIERILFSGRRQTRSRRLREDPPLLRQGCLPA